MSDTSNDLPQAHAQAMRDFMVWRRWLALALTVTLLDQVTKLLIVQKFGYGESHLITSFFNLVRVHNEGAAFSFLADEGGWQRWFFVVLGISASIWMSWLIKTSPSRLMSLSLSLIIGGALGNVVDRLAHGHVIDFLDFHFALLDGWFVGGHFPAFNLADSAITLGAVLMIIDELRRARHNGSHTQT
jgi:signal peptidase II